MYGVYHHRNHPADQQDDSNALKGGFHGFNVDEASCFVAHDMFSSSATRLEARVYTTLPQALLFLALFP